MGGTLREERERSRGRLPGSLGHREPAELPSQYPPSKAPSRSWGHRRDAREIRRDRWEEPFRRSKRGTEGDCLTHSGTGTLLSS